MNSSLATCILSGVLAAALVSPPADTSSDQERRRSPILGYFPPVPEPGVPEDATSVPAAPGVVLTHTLDQREFSAFGGLLLQWVSCLQSDESDSLPHHQQQWVPEFHFPQSERHIVISHALDQRGPLALAEKTEGAPGVDPFLAPLCAALHSAVCWRWLTEPGTVLISVLLCPASAPQTWAAQQESWVVDTPDELPLAMNDQIECHWEPMALGDDLPEHPTATSEYRLKCDRPSGGPVLTHSLDQLEEFPTHLRASGACDAYSVDCREGDLTVEER